jgi:hypothetical protein
LDALFAFWDVGGARASAALGGAREWVFVTGAAAALAPVAPSTPTRSIFRVGASSIATEREFFDGDMSLTTLVLTGFYWYDKTNMDDPKIAAVLYQ